MGKVLIIYNDKTENIHGKLVGPARLQKLKEIFVDITMRRKNMTKEEAEEKFEKDVANNEDEKDFQDRSLLGECRCP